MTENRIVALDTYDIRFPTSRELDGSDAMNPDPDYSAAYVVLRTDAADGHEGHGFAFTIGRGNDVQAAAIAALRPYLVGRPLERTLADMGAIVARAGARLTTALARPGEGRHAHGDLRGGQRVVGPQGQAGRAAPLAAAGRHVARRRSSRSSTSAT